MPKVRSHGDGGLYPIRGGKLYRGVIDGGFDADGKRVQWSVTARTKTACKKKLDDLKAEIAEHGAPLDRQTKVAGWADRWLETIAKPNVDPKTYAGYASISRRWIVPTLGTKKVSALKPSDVYTLHRTMSDAGRAVSMVRQAHIVLSMMLDAAKAERLCPRNVCDDVRKPSSKDVAARERGSLTTPQALAILKVAAAMPHSAGSRWWFKMLAGPRQGEILGATFDDLDLDGGYYRVSWQLQSLVREHGCDGTCDYKRGASCPRARWRVPDGYDKRQVDGSWHLVRPKSRTGRVVPLIPQLVEAIRRHLDATKDQPNPHGLIWRHPDGSPITPKEDGEQWRSLLAAAGVEDTTITGHWARHTTVTILASMGVDFQIIGEIVGHSSTKVTEIYRHAQDAEKRAAMQLVGAAWGEALGIEA